jgi:hypothetical protein
MTTDEKTTTGFDLAMEYARELGAERNELYKKYMDHSSVRSHLTGLILGVIGYYKMDDDYKRTLLTSLKEAYEVSGVEMSEYSSKRVAELEKKWNQSV